MFHFRFGSGCFSYPNSEEMVDMIVALNTEYTDLFEFGENCIKKIWEWEYKNNFTCQSLSERLKLLINRPATLDDIAELITHLQTIKWVDFVDFDETKMKEVVVLVAPEWNMKTFAFEMNNGYVYFEWGTSA